MDISKYNKADVLMVLYNNARPQGLGLLHYKAHDMTAKEAENHLKDQSYFDYLNGRVMKIDLSGNDLKTHLYNRDNGPGSAEKAIAELDK